MGKKNVIKSNFTESRKIILSNPWFGVGGLERVYIAVTSALKNACIVAAKNFHDPTSFPFYFGSHKPFPNLFDIDLFVEGESPHVYLAMSAALDRYIKGHPEPAAAHVTNHWGMFFSAPVNIGKTLVYFQPGVWEMEQISKSPVLLRLYKNALQEHVILSNSAYMKSMVQELFGCESRVLYPCTDTTFFETASGSREKKHDVMIFSRLNAGKQFSAAIKLFKDVENKRPGSKFLVAGAIRREDIAFLDELKSIARKNGLDEAITFVPNPSLNDLKEIYAASRLLVFFPKNEPLGLVPVEAMVAGVPVIGFDSGGVRETVIHGKTGILCKDEAEMVDAITGLLVDEKRIDKMCGNAGLVAEKFSEATFLRNLLSEVNR